LEVAGIEVEVVVPAPQAAPRIPASEDLGALALFHGYATTVGMSQPALDAALDLLRVSLCPIPATPSDLLDGEHATFYSYALTVGMSRPALDAAPGLLQVGPRLLAPPDPVSCATDILCVIHHAAIC